MSNLKNKLDTAWNSTSFTARVVKVALSAFLGSLIIFLLSAQSDLSLLTDHEKIKDMLRVGAAASVHAVLLVLVPTLTRVKDDIDEE